MIKLTRVYTRPSSDTKWHFEVLDSSSFRDNLHLNYKANNKLIFDDRQFIDGGLKMVVTQIWGDLESFQAYDSDPTLQEFWNQRDAYNQSVNITIGPKQIFTIE